MTLPFKQVFLGVLALVLLAAAPSYGQAGKDNLGKEFYVAFAANQGAGSDFFNGDTTVFALYLTGPVPAKGFVEVRSIGFRKDFTTMPGQITTIYLPDGDGSETATVEVTTSESIAAGMAVHVVADTEVAVYGMSHKRFSSDAFMAMPVDVLGTEYRAVSYPTSALQNFSSSDTPGEFWIVAAHDSTNVTITPADRTANGRTSAFGVLLNRGDVYLVQGDRNDPNNDITGSLIEAELPIAVFSGHERTEIPKGVRNLDPDNPSQLQSTSRDHLVEQVPPVSAWGDSALVVPFATSDYPDLVRIISAEDSNEITINGSQKVRLNAGEFYQITALNGPTSISATNPIIVGQFLHTAKFGLDNQGQLNPNNPAYGDPVFALIYPVEQFAKSYTFISCVNARAFSANFVNVVVEQAGIAGMVLDGQPIAASQFRPIPGSTYVYAQISLSQGTHNISGPQPFGITVYALGGVDSYAYTGGTLLKTITPFKTADLIIDFGDRVLDDTLGGEWDTTVFLQNISSDPLTIEGFMRRTGDTKKFWVSDSSRRDMSPGQIDSMTIHFKPLEADRRMHTVIQAKTEHLRAYVVDVYGRGIIARPNTFATPTSTIPIDTIDFGIHGENSPPYDTLAYIINRGSADMQVDSITLTGPNAGDFAFLGAVNEGGINEPLPFMVPKASGGSTQLDLQFTPSLPRGGRLAFLDYSSPKDHRRRIVLIARVDSIELASMTPVSFDSILICESDDGTITITNPNTFTVRLLSLDISGPDAGDFSIQHQVPVDIPSNQTITIRLRFSPMAPGRKTATVTATFDIPTNGKRSFIVQAIAKQLEAAFWSPKEIAILGNQEVLFPIYARSDLARYKSKSYTIDITYDPTYIEDVEAWFENTILPYTYAEIYGNEPGARQYVCRTYDGSELSGGGPNEIKPLVYIKFKGLIPTEDIDRVFASIEINYRISFAESPLPTQCVASDPPPGRIILDSACGPVHIEKQVGIPQEVFIDYPSPNPVPGGDVALYLYIPKNSVAHVEIISMLGKRVATVLHEEKEAGKYKVVYNTAHLPQGEYFVRFEAAGKVKTRRLGIVR